MHPHIGKAAVVLDERGAEVSRRERHVDADRQPAGSAARYSLEPSEGRVGFFDDAERRFQKLSANKRRTGATVSAFE
jgi:hypothetical protein